MEILPTAPQTSTASSTALSQLTGNLDSFLTLLTTQLKNQDPLNPLDTEKFTSQLVEFASVEQSIETNRHLQTLIGLQAAADRDGALSMIGRTVFVAGDKASLGAAGARWTYELGAGAASARLLIVDDKGRPVAQLAGDPRQGEHSLHWDGKTPNGGLAPAGVYRLIVDAKDASGAPAPATIAAATNATGALFTAAGAALETPIGPIALPAVKRVIAE